MRGIKRMRCGMEKIITGNLGFIIHMINESSSHSRCVSKRESDPRLQERTMLYTIF